MGKIDWSAIGTWVQALGALGALYFLYKTFKTQEDVLKSQNETIDIQNKTLIEQQQLTKLELDKYRDSVMPILEIIEKKTSLKEGNQVSTVSLIVKENYLHTFQLVYSLPDTVSVTGNSSLFSEYAWEGSVITIEFVVKMNNVILRVDEFYEVFEIKCKFKDRLGNIYSQNLLFKGGEMFYIEPPELLVLQLN